MKISFVEPHLKMYGGIRRIVELSNRLVQRGHDVTIFHSDGTRCDWLECLAKTRPSHEVLRHSHEVLIYNDPNPVDYSLVRQARARLKIYYVLGLYRKELLKKWTVRVCPWKKKRAHFLGKSLRSHYLILTNSTWQAEWLKQDLNIDSEILFGGVNREMFHPVEVPRDPHRVRILCSGDPRDWKGTATVVRAMAIASRHEPEIVLETYHGKGIPQGEMARTYSAADMFVEGSWYGGWNNPVAEAMACQVPVVCTDIGAVKDFAFHEKTSLVVPVKNPEATAAAIVRLIRDRSLADRLKENAYQHIGQFQWEKSAKRLEEIVENKLERREKRRFKRLVKTVVNPQRKLKNDKIQVKLKSGIHKQEYFDKYDKLGAYHWDFYDKDPAYKFHVDYISDSFKKRPRGTLLDISCGDGLISSFLSTIGFDVRGIDKERKAIELAMERCATAKFAVADVFFIKEQFEYVLASEVIEHIQEPDKFLSKVKTLFTQEALVTTPRRDYYRKRDPYHFREYSIFEFENLLEKFFSEFQIHASEHYLYAWIKP